MNGNGIAFVSNDMEGQAIAKREMNRKYQFQLELLERQIFETQEKLLE